MSAPFKSERGLLATELAILMPIILLFALLAVFVLHVERHGSRTQQAADAAARAASLTRSESAGRDAAEVAARSVCMGDVNIELFSFEPPQLSSFDPGLVTIALSCTESFRGFAALGGNGERTAQARAVSAIEYWQANE